MSGKPIFVATHPRACSTAFERVFMTRTDALQCIHEPFGDAFYFGPERLSSRFEKDEKTRLDSGFTDSTYATIMDRFEEEAKQGKRLFIKDIIHYLFPPEGKSATLAPSLVNYKRGVGTNGVNGSHDAAPKGTGPPYPYNTSAESGNPTVVPSSLLQKFHFTFLIRHPRKSVPSYYRCTIPPLSDMTGFHDFMPSEAGYDELRRFFDYLKGTGQIGPQIAGEEEHDDHDSSQANGTKATHLEVEICVMDADDLLDNPAGIIQAYCQTVGLDYHDSMLQWSTNAHHQQAKDAFEKWKGFHEDAIESSDLKPRRHTARPGTPKIEDHEWETKYGPAAARVIRETVDRNIEDYEYLKQFALQV